MKSFRLVFRLGAALAFAVTLAGCSGSESSPLGAPSQTMAAARLAHPATNPEWLLDRLKSEPAARVARGRSRMSPSAKNSGLLYIDTYAASAVNVYSSSTWNPVGELLGITAPYSMCVDAAQDVYVVDIGGRRVSEYAHGAIAPIRVLSDHQGEPIACAIDPKTGDLAISNFMGPTSGAGNVIVYRGAKGTPVRYAAPSFGLYFLVGYDDNDNLFVDGLDSSDEVLLAELPKGKSAFKPINMNVTLGFPGGVAWDGEFLAVGDQDANTIFRFKVSGSTATRKGSTVLGDAVAVFQFCLTGRSSKHPQATGVIGADTEGNAVDKWDYPAGGTPLKTITGLAVPEGVVVSN